MLKARDASITRDEILQASLDEIHRHGFQSASLTRILKNTGLTKGALYHHFRNKNELGYAVVDECLKKYLDYYWVSRIESAADPLQGLIEALAKAYEEQGDEVIQLGCPLNNLAQEMSPIDEGFRLRINALYEQWQDAIAGALQKGQMSGILRRNFSAVQVARFIIASIEGSIGIAKNAQSKALLNDCCQGLMDYLNTLKIITED
jgi:AcrR family transcriptional regulator